MTVIEDRGPELFTVCLVLLITSVTATLLRVYTRLGVVRAWGADDWTMSFACISFILFVTCAITGIHYGTGRHAADLTTPNIQEAMKYWWLCYIWYCVTMILSKISIGVFLLRLTVSRIHHYIIYLVMMLTVITGIVFFFVTLLQCHPITYFWDKDQDGWCIDTNIIAALTYLYSAFSVICDFTFAILPMFLIHTLQIDRKTKLALIPILSLACVASIAVAVRFAYIHDFTKPDFLWATVDIAIWSTTEQGLGITAGSLATLRPLFRTIAQRFGVWTSSEGIPDSNENAPRTIGSIDKSKARKALARHRGPFSLTTFGQQDDEEAQLGHGNDLKKHSKIYTTTTVTVASEDTKRSSFWGCPSRSRNESEEELNRKSNA
ncbi:hypothetical protein F5Y15DRAFT_375219 [Xylariaceae sp. FL0016]|nr:hypothetical protein F5Y15DRAFT_375219 [Xylariaceae sp. FL0016]